MNSFLGHSAKNISSQRYFGRENEAYLMDAVNFAKHNLQINFLQNLLKIRYIWD